MAIHTQESLSGFIASEPLLTETAKGDARFFARIGKEHFRREDDGSFTQTETTYHHLVMFGRSAEHAHANFAQGDNFVAEGYTRPVNYERNGQAIAAPATTSTAHPAKLSNARRLGRPSNHPSSTRPRPLPTASACDRGYLS